MSNVVQSKFVDEFFDGKQTNVIDFDFGKSLKLLTLSQRSII